MTTSPVIASGMTITSVGAQAGGMPMDGLAGLFSTLMGSAAPGGTGTQAAGEISAPQGEGMISVLLGTQTGLKGADGTLVMPAEGVMTVIAANLPEVATEQVQLGDAPALTVTGDAETLSAFVQHLKDIYQKVVVEGGLTIGDLENSSELAAALVKQGLSEEDALGVAARIETMLEILEKQQAVDEKTAGSLVAMMLAVMGQQVPVEGEGTGEQVFGLQIVSVEDSAKPAGGAVTAWQMRVSGDVTRDLLGLDAQPEAKAVPAAEAVRKVEVIVSADADASVGVALPDVKAQDNAVPLVGVNHAAAVPTAASAQAAASHVMAHEPTASRVAADEKIEAPKGETYYKLQADKNGVETLEALKPVANMQESEPLAGQSSQAQTSIVQTAIPAHMTAAGAGYAERMEKIQAMVERAGVGKQVMVQMQPLLEEGGGVVRMNLNPGGLGQITIEMTVQDGRVHGSISASESAVVEQLARELHNLRHGLADAGLKLGEQGINLMLSNGNSHDNQGQSGQNGQAFGKGGRAGGGEGGDLAENLSAWVAPDRVLDVNV
ncbi:MAG: flagellar hook-length control protein FliK [Alphaproteobacteria bacterium]|nr:MAG: flagellar hook-length control protein FliK [Alphaproteobacteria bacterium]